jgi:hypothetical protein
MLVVALGPELAHQRVARNTALAGRGEHREQSKRPPLARECIDSRPVPRQQTTAERVQPQHAPPNGMAPSPANHREFPLSLLSS